ncbi:hypothetical protein HYC85_014707, partial [Camellia sinensis]
NPSFDCDSVVCPDCDSRFIEAVHAFPPPPPQPDAAAIYFFLGGVWVWFFFFFFFNGGPNWEITEINPTVRESCGGLDRRGHGGLLFIAHRRYQDPLAAQSVRSLQGYSPLRHHHSPYGGRASSVEGIDSVCDYSDPGMRFGWVRMRCYRALSRTRIQGISATKGGFFAGFGAGVLEALVIVTPFEVVKIRLQQQRGLSHELLKYKGPVHCARLIIREEGILGLWAGAAPTVMRNGTNQAAMFSAKNAFDRLLWKKHEDDGKVLQLWQSMISGFLAGTAGPICTGPFDVVKTRLRSGGRPRQGCRPPVKRKILSS